MVLHFLQTLGRVGLPFGDLARDPQRIARAIRQSRIAGKLLIGEVRIIDERAGRLDEIDTLSAVPGGKFGTPDGRIESAGQINP
jgi:hypothetical protein